MQKLLLVAPDKRDFDGHVEYLCSEGFKLDYEENERRVLQRIEEEGFAGILFSYKKNWFQCFSICSDIKEKWRVPIFMISDYENDIDAFCAIKKGIYYFPTGSTPLYTSSFIRMFLDDREQFQPKTMVEKEETIYDVEVEKTSGQVYVRGKRIKCIGKAYDLLLCLLSKPNEYCSEEDIFQKVWKTDELLQGYQNNVRVQINNLRKCLQMNIKDISLIENERSKGYRFMGSSRFIHK